MRCRVVGKALKLYLSVKASWPHQGIVQYVSSVSGCNDNNASVALKSIHLCQELVQRLLTLIVAAAYSSSARPTHSIDLVHKDNAWCILLGLHKAGYGM